MRVQLFIPCFIDQLFPNIGFQTIQLLEKAGCTVSYNAQQTCCGQPAFNAGFWGESKDVCSKFLKDFSSPDYIVAPSASCIGFVKNYIPKLFENSANNKEIKKLGDRCFELSSFLVDVLKFDDFGAVYNKKVTYHDSCAALRECGIKSAPRQLLSKVQGLELVELQDNETCCGFGGSFAVKFNAISTAMGDQKITNALQTEANCIVSTDMSCLMHLDGCIKNQKSPLNVVHLAEVLTSGWN
ncbi:MAG: (Fe-S)-binding protein [Chitinophagaceae bacterium]